VATGFISFSIPNRQLGLQGLLPRIEAQQSFAVPIPEKSGSGLSSLDGGDYIIPVLVEFFNQLVCFFCRLQLRGLSFTKPTNRHAPFNPP
jgi:hypothetical protein